VGQPTPTSKERWAGCVDLRRGGVGGCRTQELERFEGIVFLATNRPFDLDEAMYVRPYDGGRGGCAPCPAHATPRRERPISPSADLTARGWLTLLGIASWVTCEGGATTCWHLVHMGWPAAAAGEQVSADQRGVRLQAAEPPRASRDLCAGRFQPLRSILTEIYYVTPVLVTGY
jgi:hypothetical protein